MQTSTCVHESVYVEGYKGYHLSMDAIGAVAYMKGEPAARSVSIEVLKTILDTIIMEEQRHTEEYK